MHAPIPLPDEVSAPFWEGCRSEHLLIQRCEGCRKYAYPPVKVCPSCSDRLSFESVSGRGSVYSYSQMASGARHPYFASLLPYLVGLVELEEQEGLLMWTNFPGASFSEISVGAKVQVVFETITPSVTIPQFVLLETHPVSQTLPT